MSKINNPNLSEVHTDASGEGVSRDVIPPTLAEMTSYLETSDTDKVLAHFGIKGMKWGVRRSDKELARVKNMDGDDVGGIRAQSRAAVTKLKNMKSGEVMVIDTAEGGPKVLVKQKDGSFKETTISADAQGVLRTVGKAPAEMSTREMNEAVKRAKAIEEYNKIFNPFDDPNAELKARAESIELQAKLAKAHREMNPTKAAKVGQFVKDVAPLFTTYSKVDKDLNGALSKNLSKTWEDLKKASKGSGGKAKTKTSTYVPVNNKAMTPYSSEKTKKRKTKKSDFVYDITNVK